MTDFYEDPDYQGRPFLIPVDRLPDKKTKYMSKNRDYTITGKGGKLVEHDGILYLLVKRWDVQL